jgi:polysaccharide biosynthesis transport protein
MENVEKRDPVPASQPAPELRAYLTTLWRWKWGILVVLAAVVATALFYSSRQTPLYESTAEVLVSPINFDPTQPASAGGFINMLTEERVGSSSHVASIASEQLGGSIPASIAVTSVEGTQSLLFQAVSPDPETAQSTAQAFAEAYLDFRRGNVLADLDAASQPLRDRIDQIDVQLQELQRKLLEENQSESERASLQIEFNSLLAQRGSFEQRLDDLVLPQNISVGEILQDAPFPDAPFSPDHQRTLTFAVFVGLSLGVGIAFLRDRLDRRVRGRDDLEEHVGAPALGMIPRFRSRFRARSPRLLTISDPNSGASEAFRALATSLVKSADDRLVKNVMVTSANEGEGKTLTVANLGVALAQAGKRVILISADLQRPKLETYFLASKGFLASNGEGLTDVLVGRRHASDVLSKTAVDNLWLLPAGPVPGTEDPSLNPGSMSNVLSQFAAWADLVLVDSAPLLGASDPIALAIATDAIVVVADARSTGRVALDEVRRLLVRTGTPVIGCVLTNMDPSSFPYYGRYQRRRVAKGATSANSKRADVRDESSRHSVGP